MICVRIEWVRFRTKPGGTAEDFISCPCIYCSDGSFFIPEKPGHIKAKPLDPFVCDLYKIKKLVST